MIGWSSIATTLVSTVIFAILGWVWLQFTTRGRKIWADLGRPNPAYRWIAATAALSLVLALVAVIRPIMKPDVLAVKSFRVGPHGIETSDNNPSYFENSELGDVPESRDAQVCTISHVLIGADLQAGAACELSHDAQGTPWRILAKGAAKCRVTCFMFQVGE